MCDLTVHRRAETARTALSVAELEAFTAWHLDQPDLIDLWASIQAACAHELAECQAAIAADVP